MHDEILEWYAGHARELPWRGPAASPWSVMVSEFMLQQTPVARVLPVHEEWLRRWPTPADLAAEPTGEAVRAWGRLGLPAARAAAARRRRGHRRAARRRGAGGVRRPAGAPGVGDYTAAAIATFAYGRRHVVLDTNVRRVLARAVTGVEFPGRSPTRAEREQAAALLPEDDATAATWSVALMELGALVCTAAAPRCGACPVAASCAWRAAGYPAYDGPPRPAQAWAGTDRQCRGRLLGVVRDAEGVVPAPRLDAAWADAAQRVRCLASLVEDRLLVRTDAGDYALP